ncbi:hypothetical protein Pla175_45910 [Pirellulimonas nuda]|uniref:Lipoprotein n=1 Tax=Pirellulimonas nuda TaxID=2528009 RepID=A0A518DI59_9BACT|nr:hypothetical protein [Pirellulimonas nuda]QDU91171.1 hypothetical protein Pla175_45910 [Pirellulimonas nuda]
MKRALMVLVVLPALAGCANEDLLYSIFGRPNGMERHEFRDQREHQQSLAREHGG